MEKTAVSLQTLRGDIRVTVTTVTVTVASGCGRFDSGREWRGKAAMLNVRGLCSLHVAAIICLRLQQMAGLTLAL